MGRVHSPNFTASGNEATGLYHHLMQGYTPSSAAMQEATNFENNIPSQSWESGLGGSSLQNQEIGYGMNQIFNQDKNNYMNRIVPMASSLGLSNYATNLYNKSLPYQWLSTAGGALSGLGTLAGALEGKSGGGMGSKLGASSGSGIGSFFDSIDQLAKEIPGISELFSLF